MSAGFHTTATENTANPKLCEYLSHASTFFAYLFVRKTSLRQTIRSETISLCKRIDFVVGRTTPKIDTLSLDD